MPDRPRLVYLITSHTLPDQLLRLCSVLRRGSPEARIVVHHDERRTQVDISRLASLGVERIEPPSALEWGSFSHLALHVRCLRWLLAGPHFDWVVLLSGQDYPIRPVSEIENGLAQASTRFDALIEATPCPRPSRWRAALDEFTLRYHYRWHPIPAWASALTGRARPFVRVRRMPGGPLVGWPALRSPFVNGFVCHTGADWFTLSRAAAEGIERFVRVRPQLLRYYRRTLFPTESCFQTILANDPSFRLQNDPRRYVVFDPRNTLHPQVLGCADLDAMLASGLDFARKFDATVDRLVLDELDRRVHSS